MRKSEGGQEIKPQVDFKKWLFTGLVDVTPIVFNPTADQIEAIRGFKPSVAPTYYNLASPSDPNARFSKIELLCKFNPRKASITKDAPEGNKEFPEEAFVTLSFNISKNHNTSKTGKTLFINSEARYDGIWSTWAKDIDSIDSQFEYSKDDLRAAYDGERCLINLLYAMFYKESSKEAPITGFGLLDTNWEDLCDGDVSELNALIDPNDSASEQFRSERDEDKGQINKFRILLGVKTSSKGASFNTVFTSDYDFSFAKVGKSLNKRVRERLAESFKADYQGDLSFKEYDKLKAAAAAAAIPTTTVENNTYDTSMSADDEIPF